MFSSWPLSLSLTRNSSQKHEIWNHDEILGSKCPKATSTHNLGIPEQWLHCLMEHGGVCWSMMEHGGAWWNMGEYDGAWWGMMGYDGIWWHMLWYDGAWCMVRFGGCCEVVMLWTLMLALSCLDLFLLSVPIKYSKVKIKHAEHIQIIIRSSAYR